MLLNPDRLALFVSQETGLSYIAKHAFNTNKEFCVAFTLDGYDRNSTFTITLTLKYRRLVIDFQLGEFAAALLKDLSRTNDNGRNIFRTLIEECRKKGADVNIKINNNVVGDVASIPWDKDWRRFSFVLNKGAVEIGTNDGVPDEEIVKPWLSIYFASITAILPLNSSESEVIVSNEGLPEGAKTLMEVNRYERNILNRKAAISIHGYSCVACGMNFKSVYGDIAADFIEVHHVIPVSELGENYIINPKTDLVPLCSNCHSVVHKRNPPFSIKEVRKFLNQCTCQE